MSNEENKMENQEPVIITFNGTEYRAADLNEDQMAIAAKLKAKKVKVVETAFIFIPELLPLSKLAWAW